MSDNKKNPAAVALGKLGGSKTSEAKKKAAQENAKKPRPNRKKIKFVYKDILSGNDPNWKIHTDGI